MDRPALHALVAVCVLLALAGCSMFADHTREERAVAALENATDAVESVETYRFETDMTAVGQSDGRTERVDVDARGAVNVTARAMWTNATRDGETRRSYTLNRTAYRECGEPWGGWGVEDLDADREWTSDTPAVRQLSLLESGSLYWNGTERVDGERAVLLVGEPTAGAVTQYQERSRPLLGGPSVDDAEARVWLDAETHRPLRMEIRIEVTGDGTSATARLTTRFDGYGTPVAVTHHALDGETYELGCPGE